MDNIKHRLSYLIERYINQFSSKEEEREMFELINNGGDDQVEQLLMEMLENSTAHYDAERMHRLLANILANGKASVDEVDMRGKKPAHLIQLFRKYRVAIAAILILFISISGYFLFIKKGRNESPVSLIKNKGSGAKEISPGGNKAMLTLTNGQTIGLDSAANGLLAMQGAAKVIKLANGQLEYHVVNNPNNAISYNIMTTPRGGQYKLRLPDGTDVWLNAASSIRYPTAFVGNQRKVEITGEAYFEVAKNKAMPFFVEIGGAEIEVLGTHFNVNAYADEASIKTTLLEGSVKVKKGDKEIAIAPGQQAIVSTSGLLTKINDADVEEAVAWKDGFFQFHQADIQSIMRQISRWYDVDIKYQGKIPERKFEGEISRDLNLSQMLHVLDMSNIDFRLDGRVLIIEPNKN